MVTSGAESVIAAEVVQLLRAPQDMSYEMRCWSIGALLDRRTQGWPPARIDGLLRTIVSEWRPDADFGVAFEAAFDTLAEDYFIYRCFPEGLPPLSWHHLRHLCRIADNGERAFYTQEAEYRGWGYGELAMQIRASVFAGRPRLQPAWAPGGDEVLAVACGGETFYVIERIEAGSESAVVSMDLATRTRRELGRLHTEAPSCHILAGTLYIAANDGLYRHGGGGLELVVASRKAHCAALVAANGRVVSLWNAIDEHDHTRSFRVAILGEGGCRWSAPLPGGAVACAALGARWFVRTRAPDVLLELELDPVRQVAEHRMGTTDWTAPMLARAGQLVVTDALHVFEREIDLNDGATFGGRTVREVTLSRGFPSLTCFEFGARPRRRDWRLGQSATAITELADERGLIVTGNDEVFALHAFHPRPIVVARFPGQVRGAPVVAGPRLCWLVDARDGVSVRRSSLEIFDANTGIRSFVRLELADRPTALARCGEHVVVATARGPVVYCLQEVFDAAVRDIGEPVPLRPTGATDAMIGGLPLAGPRNEGWALEVDPALAAELLSAADHARWRAAATSAEQAQCWQRSIDAAIKAVEAWPDAARQLTKACPRELLALTESVERETRDSPPFGSQALPLATIAPVLAWKRKIETAISSPEPAESARRRARLLLYAHMLDCQTHRTLHVVDDRFRGVEWVTGGITHEAQNVLAWMNLDKIRPNRVRDAVFSVLERVIKATGKASVTALGLGLLGWLIGLRRELLVVAAAGFLVFGGIWVLAWLFGFAVARFESHHGTSGFRELGSAWSGGCPPLIQAPDAFVRFVQDCVQQQLLLPAARSRLARAISRAWAHPLVHRGAMVFISYSGKQAELALRLAGSLQHRGVECVLDRYELELDVDDTHVECWIAESLMKCHVLIHIVSGDVQNSGWVHRESEWQRRLLGLKSSLVLPYLIVLGDLEQAGDYPRCRVIPGSDLVARWDLIVDHLTARIALEWLLAVKAGDGRSFGIAYEGKSRPVVLWGPSTRLRTTAR